MGRVFKEFNDEKWEQVRTHPYFAKLRENVLKKSEEFLATEPPVVKFSLIHRYVIDGNREEAERIYNNYFARMNSYFVSYLLTNDEKYLSPLADVIWNICDFESWSIPAHVRETMSVAERRRNLDLCSTIAGYRLAELIYFIGDKLPELVVRRAKDEIRYRVIDSYKDATAEKYWWLKATNNWSAVCIAAVLGTYIYAATDAEIKTQLPRMMDSANCYLEGFDDDGCCLEGYGYWNYGFSYFCVFAELLREYTDGKINYFKDPKVEKIAKFQESIPLSEDQCVSFSDSGSDFHPSTWLSHFLKGVYPDLRIPKLDVIIHNTPPLRYVLWQDPDLAVSSLDATEPVSFFFDDAQWFIYRCPDYSFACKGGSNGEPHNHNDVGSFIFSKNGKITFTDPGCGEYTRQYFSSERYTHMLCASRGHSVPIINGKYQKTTGRFERAKILDKSDTSYGFTMQHVYDEPTLTALERRFVCEKGYVRMCDKYEFTEAPVSLTERFIALAPLTVTDKGVECEGTVLEYNKELYDVELGMEKVSRHGGGQTPVYYIDLKVKDLKANITLEFTVR